MQAHQIAIPQNLRSILFQFGSKFGATITFLRQVRVVIKFGLSGCH